MDVDDYMRAITHGFNLDNMVAAFLSGVGLFSLARLGGIPVPSSLTGTIFWYIIFAIQIIEYFLILLSLTSLSRVPVL